MPILSYTTQSAAERTLMEISRILTQHSATASSPSLIVRDVAALSFRVPVGDIAFMERYFELFVIFR